MGEAVAARVARPPFFLNLSTSLFVPPLSNRAGARVTLFEKEATFGGHTLTDDSLGYPVDLGFQVRRRSKGKARPPRSRKPG